MGQENTLVSRRVEADGKTYVVQQNDNLVGIANAFGLGLVDIMEMNKQTITDPNKIFIGQKITVKK